MSKSASFTSGVIDVNYCDDIFRQLGLRDGVLMAAHLSFGSPAAPKLEWQGETPREYDSHSYQYPPLSPRLCA